MTPADRMALLMYSGGGVDVLQDFTDDRGRLLTVIDTVLAGEGQGNDELAADESAPDTGSAFGQDDSEFNVFKHRSPVVRAPDRGAHAGPA